MARSKVPPNEKLRTWRTDVAKLTQTQAAELVEVTAATWCDWEQGNKIPSLHSAKDIETKTKGAVTLDEWIGVSRSEAAARTEKREHRKAAS